MRFYDFWRSGFSCFSALLLTAFLCCDIPAVAKSPAAIAEGRLLFEKDWAPRNPQLGNDGLGPLFNGRSCVACHHQGGVGGGGDARFNAKTIGIDRMKVGGINVSDDMVGQAVRQLHPGFVGSGGMSSAASISHHGGTPEYERARKAFMKRLPAVFSDHGGPISASEVRQANAMTVLHTSQVAGRPVAIQARLFQRNTPALYGAGLVDRINDKMIEALVREQKKHPEISGRPATLESGLYGRFGWRGNVPTLLDFCDQACANELGLETDRLVQPSDPTQPAYQNPSEDISDSMIKRMASFIAALPAPERRYSDDADEHKAAIRGEQVFASVGCAVCHVPNVGPAKGIYSDILLHDMGPESYDVNAAEPHIKRFTRLTPVRSSDGGGGATSSGSGSGTESGSVRLASASGSPTRGLPRSRATGGGSSSPTFASRMGYYGGGASLATSAPSQPRTTLRPRGFDFVASPRPLSLKKRIRVDSATSRNGKETIDLEFSATNIAHEWRTPPLWGVRDSAPYMHDGRAETLLEAIMVHEGEAAKTRDRFLMLSVSDRNAVIEFLNTMVAPSTAPQPKL